MKPFKFLCLLSWVVVLLITPALAQPFLIPWSGLGVDNNWATANNWDYSAITPPQPPDTFPTGSFDEIAVIDNGDTVLINTDLDALAGNNGPPGGLTASNNSVLSIEGAGAFLTDPIGAAVDGSVNFTTGSMLSITGPSATFSSESLSFDSGGFYAPIITGASHGLISVSGGLTLGGGTLQPSFDGHLPSISDTWVLADASGIAGSIAIDSSSLGLPGVSATVSVVPGGLNGNQVVMGLRSALTLQINVDDGSAELVSKSGDTTAIRGYGIASGAGQFAPAGWNSFEDQAIAGWEEAGVPSVTNLDELAGPINGTTVGNRDIGLAPVSIGNPVATDQPFGQAASDDYSFEYVTSDGELQEGLVEVTGLNLINNLLLTIDPTTGEAELKNSSTSTLQFRGYSILSASGSLKPGAGDWNSLADQGVTGVEEANPKPTDLSELISEDADTLELAPGATFLLGDLFDTSGIQDLELEFVVAAGSDGDFDEDGDVDGADFLEWQRTIGTAGALADWNTNYGSSGGSGGAGMQILAGVVLESTVGAAVATSLAVPEPSSLVILSASILLWCCSDRREESHA